MRINLALCWLVRSPLVYQFNCGPSRANLRSFATMDSKGLGCAESRSRFVDIGANLTDRMYEGYYHGSSKHTPDLDEVLSRAVSAGVEKIMVTSGCLKEVRQALEMCNRHDKGQGFLYTTVGVHPTRCNEFVTNKYSKTDSEYLDALDELISKNRERVVAVGELGLDYDRLQFCERETQKKYFEFQLSLAEKHKLPLFLHMRNADADTLDILRRNKHKWAEAGGVVHSYTGSAGTLQELLDEGLYVGVNGCSLKTEDNLNTVKKIPLDRLLLETDCPWCGIKASHASGKFVKTKFNSVKNPYSKPPDATFAARNEPCHIVNVAEVVYEVMAPDMKFPEFCQRVFENTLRLFGRLRDGPKAH